MVETGGLPSTMALLSFASSLVSLGCAVRSQLWLVVPPIRPRCRMKFLNLWKLPELIMEKARLNQEWVRALTQNQAAQSVNDSKPALAGIQDWTDRRCAEWLAHEVKLPEHVPLFRGAAINGSKLLRLDERKLKALGIDDIDSEIILARLQRLERECARESLHRVVSPRPKSKSRGLPQTMSLGEGVLSETGAGNRFLVL